MRRATALMGAALVLFATAASAQEKPNFAGKWTLDAEKTAAANPNAPQGGGRPGGPGGMGGNAFTLTLDAGSLTRESEGRNGPMKTVYKLDGSETEVGMGQMTGKAKAKWEGATLVIETTIETPNGARATKAVYTIEGDYLVIANTRQTPNGEVTTRMYYKRG